MNTTEARGGFAAGELSRVAWHISSRSGNGSGSTCVEAGPIADGTGRVAVRHSHHPHGHALVYTRDEWEAFLTSVKAGDFTA